MKKSDLQTTEYNDYIAGYIAKVDANTELKAGFEINKKRVINFFTAIPENKLSYQYAPEKWTIKDILQHMIDTERIFMYRMLCIARNDKTAFPGYDQDRYITPAGANQKSLPQLLKEFTVTREYTINLVHSLTDKAFKNMGTVSNIPISARACAFTILGHNTWHIEIIKNNYL